MCDNKVATTSPKQFTGLSEDALEIARKLVSATQEPITKIEAAKLSEALLNVTQNNQILKAVINGAPTAYAVNNEATGELDHISFNKGYVIERVGINNEGAVGETPPDKVIWKVVPVKIVVVAK